MSGRGELHLSVLIESMRREGFELGVSRPEVIIREVDGGKQEPFEYVVIDIEDQHQGAVMEAMGLRKGDMKNMEPDGQGRVRLEYIIKTRIDWLSITVPDDGCPGTGVMSQVFDHYGPVKTGELGSRINGVLVSMTDGTTTAYSLYNLQDRGTFNHRLRCGRI